METDLSDDKMDNLLTLVEEAARSTADGVKRFIEPAQGTLRRATTRVCPHKQIIMKES